MVGEVEDVGNDGPGFFAVYVTVNDRQIFSVDGLDQDTAVFAEPTARAMTALVPTTPRGGRGRSPSPQVWRTCEDSDHERSGLASD